MDVEPARDGAVEALLQLQRGRRRADDADRQRVRPRVMQGRREERDEREPDDEADGGGGHQAPAQDRVRETGADHGSSRTTQRH